MTAVDTAAVRAARALRHGFLRAVEDHDLAALISNLAGWMRADLSVRAAVLAEEKAARFEHGESG